MNAFSTTPQRHPCKSLSTFNSKLKKIVMRHHRVLNYPVHYISPLIGRSTQAVWLINKRLLIAIYLIRNGGCKGKIQTHYQSIPSWNINLEKCLPGKQQLNHINQCVFCRLSQEFFKQKGKKALEPNKMTLYPTMKFKKL